MKLSKAMLISVFITAVVLVVAAGVTSAALANKSAAQAPDAKALQEYQQREEQYKQAIQQANQQIEQANQNLQTLQSQVTQLQGGDQPVSAGAQGNQAAGAPAAAAPAPAVAVSAQQASQIAAKVVEAWETVKKAPELVNFQGKAAYEVIFEKGNVYIDAQTGEVLFNGTIPQKVDAAQAAKIAGDYLNDHVILKVDQVPFHGQQLWRVIFKSGVMAYLDPTGQITYIQPKEVKVVVEQNSGGGGAAAPVASHESEREHEHDGHDD